MDKLPKEEWDLPKVNFYWLFILLMIGIFIGNRLTLFDLQQAVNNGELYILQGEEAWNLTQTILNQADQYQMNILSVEKNMKQPEINLTSTPVG